MVDNMSRRCPSKEVRILLEILRQNPNWHSSKHSAYGMLRQLASDISRLGYDEDGVHSFELRENLSVQIDFFDFGNINSLHLFGIDELIIFAFYVRSRDLQLYRSVLDLGANIGLHSLVLGKLGYKVVSYEPDPLHYKALTSNLIENGLTTSGCRRRAVADVGGVGNFVRVLGNTTGSHLEMTGRNPYGDLEKFEVEIDAFSPLMREFDLIKIDVEGAEHLLCKSTSFEDWRNTDGLMEVSSKENRSIIFEHLRQLGIGMFPQKIGWAKASTLEDLPCHHSEGSLFVSVKPEMPW